LGEPLGRGEFLANRFEILNAFKTTPLAQTYLALDRLTQKKVIVKQGKCQAENERKSKIKIERLMLEAQVLKALNHPSVVKYVYSWGSSLDFYLVTEYVDAKSMKETFMHKPPSRESVIEYMFQLLEVVEYLHSKSVVHRDIKPSHILLGDIIVLIDFDASESNFLSFQHTKGVIGTPGYQSPESHTGAISIHGDVYSIGATLLFLLTGENPTCDLSRFKNLTGEQDLLNLAFKALNPNPEDRFRTAFEMKQKLRAISSRQTKLVYREVQYSILKNPVFIGRGVKADFRIRDPSKFVSPIHAEISLSNGNHYVSNRSINGTYIYRRDEYQKIDKWELHDGDAIVLCYSPQMGPYKILKYRRNA
jgi:serine/threonine protein kinase